MKHFILKRGLGGLFLIASFILNVFIAHADPAGLISHWQAESNALDTLSQNNGTAVNGVTYAPGAIGSAFSLNGSAYVNVTSPTFNAYSNGFTVMAWIKMSSYNQAASIVNLRTAPNSSGFTLEQLFGNSGSMLFAVNQTGVSEGFATISASGWQLDTFYHIAATFDAASGTMALYRNGVLVASTNNLPHTNMATVASPSFEIGRNVVATGFVWNGLIDDVRFYDHALSAGEIASLAGVSTQSYDLNADWSDTANPNGRWSYREGTNALPLIAAWGPDSFTNVQPAWARAVGLPANNYIPGWMKSRGSENFTHDWQAGDVVVHTTDPANGVGNGPANVIWSSPISGTISVSGNIWMGRDIGRGNHWTLYLNNTVLTSGDVSSGDIYSRTNPFSFSAATNSAALNSLSVVPDDVLKLEIVKTSSSGDFVGVNLSIAASRDCGLVGWTAWTNGHYYKLVVQTNGIVWSNAVTAAQAQGGYLVSITSAEENAFVYSLASERASAWYYNTFNCAIGPWLGAFQTNGSPEPAGGWNWVSGEPFTYQNWWSGEPNNSGGTEHIVHMYICNGAPMGPYWNDITHNAEVRSYIIERNTAPVCDEGLVFVPVCTNLTVLLSAAYTNCVVSTNYMTNATTVLNNIVGLWKADGNVLDSSANGNHGAIHGSVIYESGVHDQAFSIPALPYAENATARRVELGNLPVLNSATAFSVSAWVKMPPAPDPSSSNDWTFIATFPAQVPNPGLTNETLVRAFGLFATPSGIAPSRRATYTIAFSDGTTATVGTTAAMPTNQFAHLAVTWSSASGSLRMYKNGLLDGTTTAGLGKTLPTAAQRNPNSTPLSVELGVWDFVSDTTGALTRYGGSAAAIDDFRIYTRALATNEIQLIYNGEPPVITNTVVTNCAPVDAVTTNLNLCTTPAGKLKISTVSSDLVNLFWSSQTNSWYLLQRSDEVLPLNWTDVWVGQGNGTNVIVPQASNLRSRRFYRLLSTE